MIFIFLKFFSLIYLSQSESANKTEWLIFVLGASYSMQYKVKGGSAPYIWASSNNKIGK